MPYFIPITPAQTTLEIKNSQFIGYGFPIDSREQVMFHVEQLRTQYPDARHVCWAYSGTAQAVVDNMDLSEFVPLKRITINTDFANESFVRHVLMNFHADILSTDYDKEVILTAEIAEQAIKDLTEKIGFYGIVRKME